MSLLARILRGSTGAPTRTTPAPTETDRAHMARALELAHEAASAGEAPIGAVVYITDTGEAIAEARNTRETERDPAGHAEFTAIRAACARENDWRLNHCTIVVTLEPCPMCAGLIVGARLGRVVYGADDPKAGACRSLYRLADDPRLNHRAEIVPGVEAEASAELLRAFFRDLRKRRRDA